MKLASPHREKECIVCVDNVLYGNGVLAQYFTSRDE